MPAITISNDRHIVTFLIIAPYKYSYLLTYLLIIISSLVTLCSHKSGRCTVELYHASHLWYPPFYTSPMASSALKH